METAPKTNHSDFGGNPVHDPDAGFPNPDPNHTESLFAGISTTVLRFLIILYDIIYFVCIINRPIMYYSDNPDYSILY